MFAGAEVVDALQAAGVTHVVWLPDSDLGTWDAALSAAQGLTLVRVCREGEAFAVAAGLFIAGQRPVIVIQCTGLFEAGDSLRNALYDLRAPLFTIVGVRSAKALRAGTTSDSCPVFVEPIMKAWNIPYVFLDDSRPVSDLAAEYVRARAENRPGAVLIAE